jgi:hypothetical protein
MRANSSPVMLLHHLVCCIEPRGTATFKQASSSPMSRRHSSAAMFVICARGVSAVWGVAASMMPFIPVQVEHKPSLVGIIFTIVCKKAGQRRARRTCPYNQKIRFDSAISIMSCRRVSVAVRCGYELIHSFQAGDLVGNVVMVLLGQDIEVPL